MFTFLLGATLVSLTINAFTTRPSQAESFLYKTTCNVVGLLGVNCKTTPRPTTSETPAPTEPVVPTQQAADSVTPAQPTTTSTPAVEPPVLPELPAIEPVDTVTNTRLANSNNSLAYVFPLPSSQKSNTEVLGATSNSAFETSSEGWLIFGLAWYWWVIVGMTTFIGVYMIRRFIVFYERGET